MNEPYILKDFEPKKVFYFFEEISKIPRGSGNTKEISDYLVNFAKNRNLEFYQDDFNNVIIYKDEIGNHECLDNENNKFSIGDKNNKFPIILQGHIDMVCEKSPKSSKNMEIEGIDLEIDGDFISAKETTLGADNGIAVAMILAILDNDNLYHPPIEAVFTSDEEIGLIGADNLDMSKLNGKSLINLDSEEEGIMVVSCAGGNRLDIEIPIEILEYSEELINESKDNYLINISIEDLKGGHSGIEIDKGLANSNKLLGELLKDFSDNGIDIRLIDIFGGKLDNAIANNSSCSILSQDIDKIKNIVKRFEVKVNDEFKAIEDNIKINIDFNEFLKELSEVGSLKVESSKLDVLSEESTNNIIDFLNCVPNGVCKMSEDIEDLVETSLNLGIINLDEDNFKATLSVRSSIDLEKEKLNNKIISIAQEFRGICKIRGNYPGWEFKKDSKLQRIICEEYEKQYNQAMMVNAIHAGLECGLFVSKINDLDAVSIGPNLFDVHSYNEKMSISSVFRTYNLLIAILERLSN